jgi:hypothetical protein
MTGEKLKAVEPVPEEVLETETKTEEVPALPGATVEELDEEEAEFRAMRRDLPGVKGSSGAGIVAVGVSKTPGKHEFFRTHPDFRPVMSMVDVEIGMDKHYLAVMPDMIEPLTAIGITVADHCLYLTITARGAYKIIPVRQANEDGEMNEYNRTKEIGLVQGIDEWVRLFTDKENGVYKVFPAPKGRFPEAPNWPDLKQSRIIRLAFKDRGRLIDTPEHPLFKKWTARDAK